MIGELRSVVLDCPDPQRLARFWAEVLGGEITQEDDDWVVVTGPDGRRVACQLSPEHRPPEFPDPHASQQIHFDILVSDVDAAQAAIIDLGATWVLDADEDDFRVFRDPAGHTFCLVWND
ncbi:VOC family protein [Mycolicibacterium sp. 018/SC-01/001]|uniref:VOC family protein n=1 Tax=Mycolicibacterium sp. 018/SC-01/001 TaxID=2592069 RepID=UPI00117CEF98|nr:VOC family protein [Mycolicibacterium sp. 018/SC-01/001]TRW78406.1 VOC family protein [Mycolicibacterium sp. 018/SC-01/001]